VCLSPLSPIWYFSNARCDEGKLAEKSQNFTYQWHNLGKLILYYYDFFCMKICSPPEGKVMPKAVHCVATQICPIYSTFLLLYTLSSHPNVITADILE